jgi:hypothetical protein
METNKLNTRGFGLFEQIAEHYRKHLRLNFRETTAQRSA